MGLICLLLKKLKDNFTFKKGLRKTTFRSLNTLNLQLVTIFTLKFWKDVLEQVTLQKDQENIQCMQVTWVVVHEVNFGQMFTKL